MKDTKVDLSRVGNTDLYLYYYDSNVLELMGVSLINVAVAHS